MGDEMDQRDDWKELMAIKQYTEQYKQYLHQQQAQQLAYSNQQWVEWSTATKTSTTTNITNAKPVQTTICIPSSHSSPPPSSDLAWLDRRVNEIRVQL